MAGMMDMMKQASQMRKQMKEMQKQMATQKCEYETGGIKVVVSGDMTIQSIEIEPSLLESGKPSRLERALTSALNAAMKKAQKEAAMAMAQNGDMGALSSMFGK